MTAQPVYDVLMTDIKLDGINVRTDLDTPNSVEALKELAESIKVNGLMQPVMLRGAYGTKPYDVIAGHRRFRAHELLGKKSIRAVFSGAVDNTQALLMSLSENMCRQELNFSDTAEAVTKLYKAYGNDDREVSNHLGISLRKVRIYIKIEEQATPKIREMLSNGSISSVDARRAIDASQGDAVIANDIAEKIAGLTKYEKGRLVELGKKSKITSVDDAIADAKKPKIEDTLILNLPIQVKDALVLASTAMDLEPEELTMKALVSWLQTNDYLLEQV